MTQGERIKELRTYLKLTLEKFGERLGVTKVAISNIEKGNRNLTEQMAKAICREYGVNYIWLTTGDGNMFVVDDDLTESIDRILAGENEFHKNLFKAVAKMSEKDLIALETGINALLKTFTHEELTASTASNEKHKLEEANKNKDI